MLASASLAPRRDERTQTQAGGLGSLTVRGKNSRFSGFVGHRRLTGLELQAGAELPTGRRARTCARARGAAVAQGNANC